MKNQSVMSFDVKMIKSALRYLEVAGSNTCSFTVTLLPQRVGEQICANLKKTYQLLWKLTEKKEFKIFLSLLHKEL